MDQSKKAAAKRKMSSDESLSSKKKCVEDVTLPSSTWTPSPDGTVLTRKASGRGLQGKQVMLAQKHTDSTNPKNWWISEKLDGVRAFWDGKHFYSRLGNRFFPPAWFTEAFPSDYELDGELFVGRGQFRSTVSIVKTKSNIDDAKWKTVKFHIFDAPNISGTFEHRINTIAQYFKENESSTAVVLSHTKCRNKEHVETELKRVENLGGEGLMIRKPGSSYEECRSYNLLKIKTFYDAEARIIGYKQGQGRNSHRVGAFHCIMECGKKFHVGSGLSDKDRNKPPKKGTIITYRFQELTNSGMPRFPSYVGIRIDMTEPKDAVIPVPSMQ
ncbi:DNA ligase-like [Amphiura filiformis]|uniref:DNA ligase-like n=1 Tax=Amphiura filiformis TaxID=82378 RepID=UPI003B218AEB